MFKAILGTKSNMSSTFNRFGHQVPVTTVMAEPNIIIGLKDQKVVLGLGKYKKTKKTEASITKIAGHSPRFIREVSFESILSKDQKSSQENSLKNQEESKKINLGDKVTVSIFEPGDEVKVTGTTKGKGFAGTVKRWNFAGGPKTHGQSDRHRAPGSIGMGTTPGRVFKGKKMAGHLGNEKLTITGLEIIEVDESKNLLLIKGPIPGPRNGFLKIEKTGKVKGYTPPPSPSEEKQAEKETREEDKQKPDAKGEEPTEKQVTKPKENVNDEKNTKEIGKENAKS